MHPTANSVALITGLDAIHVVCAERMLSVSALLALFQWSSEMRIKKALAAFLILNLLIIGDLTASGYAQQEERSRITPTPDPNSPSRVYIPANLEECFAELNKMIHPSLIAEMRQGTERDMILHHLGLGMWIRNNWRLWAGSRLATYFNNLGIHHPEDMSGIILDTYWCHLNDRPLRIEERIQRYQAYWRVVARPTTLTFPECRAGVEYTSYLNAETADGMPRAIHIGRCRSDNSLWVFEHERGWYRPDAELTRRIEEGNDMVSFIEMTTPSRTNRRRMPRRRNRNNRRP
jgi:hypothetical protein